MISFHILMVCLVYLSAVYSSNIENDSLKWTQLNTLVQQHNINLKGMECDASSVQYDSNQCQFLDGADWIVGVETSWYDASSWDCGRNATLHSYSKTVDLALLLLKEMQVELNFSADHRLGVHFADSRHRTVKPLCAHQYNRPFLVTFPTVSELQLTSYEGAAPILTIANSINDEVTRMCRRRDTSIFIFLFLQKITMSNYHSNDVRSFFTILNKWRSKSIKVFLISVNYCSRSIFYTHFTSTPEHQVSGHIFVDSTGNTVDDVMPVLARYILRCGCRKGEKCRLRRVATTGCRFEQTPNGGEICYENVTREILSQPDSFDKATCATEIQQNCTHEECMADCDLKGWTPWGLCKKPSFGPKRNYSRLRKRVNLTAGRSQKTKSCFFQDVQYNCQPSDVPIRGVGQFQATTTTESTTISEDYGADTHSPPSTIRTTISSTTTTEAPAFSIYGLNAAVILAIVAGLTLILIIIGGATLLVFTRERRRLAAGRFKIMLVPTTTTPSAKTLSGGAPAVGSPQRSKKSSKTAGSTKSSQQSSKRSKLDAGAAAADGRLPTYKPQPFKGLKTLPSIQDRTQKILSLPRTPSGQNKFASKKKSSKKAATLKAAPGRRP